MFVVTTTFVQFKEKRDAWFKDEDSSYLVSIEQRLNIFYHFACIFFICLFVCLFACLVKESISAIAPWCHYERV